MNNASPKLKRLVLGAVIAAIYTVLTLILPMLSYGPIQIRFSEALTVLPFLFPEAIPGLAVGCFLANLIGSPYPLDMIFGTAATLLAALWTGNVKHKWFAPLPPVICNAVIVGAEIAITSAEPGSGAFWSAFAYNALTVGLGELIACYVLGMILLKVFPKIRYLAELVPENRRDRI